MHKVYLLLRNNKKQGPYCLEEIIQQNLQPFDLVWVEGKSVGWKYPGEIDTLKSHVAAAPNIETKSALVVESKQAIQPEKSYSLQPQPLRQSKRQKIFVSLPDGKTVSAPVTEEEDLSKKLEKKAEELYQRAQKYAEQRSRENTISPTPSYKPSTAPDELTLDTKYSRSLEDIKDEYTSWLFEQKQHKKRPVYKTSLTVGATILLLAVGYTAAKIAFQQNDDSTISKQSILPTKSENSDLKKTDISVSKTKSKANAKKIIPPITKGSTGTRKKPNNATATSRKPASKDPVVKQNPPKPVQVMNPVFLPDQVKITGQYSTNKKGIPDFDITVKNNSNQKLRFVAVDVFYYRKDGSLAGKKTLYFNKVAPNSIMTLTAPGNSKADDVIFKMGLMSSEKGELYYTKL